MASIDDPRAPQKKPALSGRELDKELAFKKIKIEYYQGLKAGYQQHQREYEEVHGKREHERLLRGQTDQEDRRRLAGEIEESGRWIKYYKEQVQRCEEEINRFEGEIQQMKDEKISAARSHLDKALQSGYVLVQLIMCLVVGAAGTGKSCLKSLLLGKKPPNVRSSTPCAERPTRVEIRAVSGARVLSAGGKWKEISEQGLLMMIATALSLVEDDSVGTEQSSEEASGGKGAKKSKSDRKKRSLFSSFKNRLSQLLHSSRPPQDPSLDPSPQEQSAATKQALTTIKEKLVVLISRLRGGAESQPSKKDSDALFDSRWVYFTDSGGQPQFLELFPLFIHNTSATLFVLRLSESLDDFPSIEYYKDGQRLGSPQVSPFSTIDTLRYLVQTMQSRPTGGKPSKIMIVGTHKDKQGECSESLKEKNEKLIEMLGPEFSEQLVFYNYGLNQLIFPVDTAHPEDHEHTVADQIQQEVEGSEGMEVKVPIWWYILELILRELTSLLGRRVLSKSECLELSRALGFDDEEVEGALKFFHDLNLFHYYPEILPEVVFADSQVPLDKVTELVEFSFSLRQAMRGEESVQPVARLGGKWKRFRDEGVVTLEFLERFQQHYVNDVFTPAELIRLLNELLVVAHLSDPKEELAAAKVEDSYFMPSLLEVVPRDQLEQHRVSSSSAAAPLLVRFPHGCPRAGVFCCTVVYLMKRCGWEILLPSGDAILVARNCIKFQVLSSPPCEVTLIDSFSYVEVHISVRAALEECTDLFPSIQQSVFDGIDAACVTLHYANARPHPTFFCPHPAISEPSTDSSAPSQAQCQELKRHTATLTPDKRYWRCDRFGNCSGRLESQHSIWFAKESLLIHGPPLTYPTVTAALKTLVDWHTLGVKLEIEKSALDKIRLDFDKYGQTRQSCEMVDLWLRSNTRASWDKLCRALDNMDERTLAASIRYKYCV